MSGESLAEDFKRRVENNGPSLRDFSVSLDDTIFGVRDAISKNINSWAMIPDVDDEEAYVQEKGEELWEKYERLDDAFEEVSVETGEDDYYWAIVTVEVPEDSTRRERIAEQVGEALY